MTDFVNVTKNPTLNDYTFREMLVDIVDDGSSRKEAIIEDPNFWRYWYTSMVTNHPNRIPESYHRSPGFGISAGDMEWLAGYEQWLDVVAGQHYLCKAVFIPDFNNLQTHHDIQWSFAVIGQTSAESAWSSPTSLQTFKQEHECLFVFKALATGRVLQRFRAMAEFGNPRGELLVKSIEALKVGSDWTPMAEILPLGATVPPPVVTIPPVTQPPTQTPPPIVPVPTVPAGFPFISLPLPIGNDATVIAFCNGCAAFYQAYALSLENAT